MSRIASENFASRAVLETAGTVMTNKYAEGMAGRRYYGGGCEMVDVAEKLAEARARELLGRVRQCAATLGKPGQYGGLPGISAAW